MHLERLREKAVLLRRESERMRRDSHRLRQRAEDVRRQSLKILGTVRRMQLKHI